jgi:hypothetical protein
VDLQTSNIFSSRATDMGGLRAHFLIARNGHGWPARSSLGFFAWNPSIATQNLPSANFRME